MRRLAQYIVSNLTTIVLWFDSDLFLRAINPAGEYLLGLSGKQACGLHADALFLQCGQFGQALQRASLEYSQMTEHGIRLLLLSGKPITVDYTITSISEVAGGTYLLAEMINVDQHLRLAREENLLLQQQAVQTVIRGLAHEIKNPLGGLRGAAQLLARELPEPGLREYTDIIIAEADRLQSLLNQLLGPRSTPRKKPVNIHRILFRVSQLIMSESGTGIRINKDFDPSLPDVEADADQLMQAVLNVMRNAVQAMEGRGVILLRTRIRRKMTLGQKYHKLVMQLDIMDNGPGVPDDISDQIFYPMVTGRADGSGLGLSIAQNLINRNGGIIGCNSEPGCTVFSLWLPIPDGGENTP